jgi:hypothetical protein
VEKAVVRKSPFMRSVNQRITEAKEVTDSWLRTKPVTAGEKKPVFQEGME